jgi:hypothetical protein
MKELPMPTSSITELAFQKMIRLQEKQTKLLLEDLRNNPTTLFGANFLDRYGDLHAELCEEALGHFVRGHVDFRGTPILAPDLVKVSSENVIQLAPLVIFSGGSVNIVMPPIFFLLLDLVTLGQTLYDLVDAEEVTVDFSYEFMVIAEVLSLDFRGAIRSVSGRGRKVPDHLLELAVFKGLLAKLSVFYHELAHFLSGHGRTRMDDRAFAYNEHPTKLSSGEDPLTTWGAEIMADTYACLRLYTFYDQPARSILGACRKLDRVYMPVFLLAEALLAPLILVNAIEATGKGSFPQHPDVYLRVVNIFSALYFGMEPIPNQNFDIRKTELSGTSYYSSPHTTCDQHLLLATLTCLRSASALRLPLAPDPAALARDVIVSAKTLRFGQPSPEGVTDFSVDALILSGLWRRLSMGENFSFAHSFLPGWFQEFPDLSEDEIHDTKEEIVRSAALGFARRLPLIRDPIYKIIDDWMSSIARWDDDESNRQKIISHYVAEATQVGRMLHLF